MYKKLQDLRKINLAQYVIAYLGYKPIKGKDTRKCRILQSPDGVKIMTYSSPNAAGDYYFHYLDEEGGGDVVNLLTRSHGYTYQRIREEFLEKKMDWQKLGKATPTNTYTPTQADTKQAKARYASGMRTIRKQKCKPRDGYFAHRGITLATLKHFGLIDGKEEVMLPLFSLHEGQWVFQTAIRYLTYKDDADNRYHIQRFLAGERGSASILFDPFRDNSSATTFTIEPAIHTLFLFESPVDALSYYQLFAAHLQGQRHVYLSTCGNPPDVFFKKMPEMVDTLKPKHVFVLFDNDKGGRRLAARVCQSLEGVQLPGHIVDFCFDHPAGLPEKISMFSFMERVKGVKVKDWNDLLMNGYKCRCGCC